MPKYRHVAEADTRISFLFSSIGLGFPVEPDVCAATVQEGFFHFCKNVNASSSYPKISIQNREFAMPFVVYIQAYRVAALLVR